ncbi:MAG: hypothetical protein ACXU86_09990 [Archangium sp.]
MDDEEGEQLGSGGAIFPGGGIQEGGTLAVEDIGARAQRPQGAEADGGPVIQLLHQPGHVNPVLQLDELRGRGAREK